MSPLLKALCWLCLSMRIGGKFSSQPARPCVFWLPPAFPSHLSPLSLFIMLRLDQLSFCPSIPCHSIHQSLCQNILPVLFPWMILSPQRGLISRLKKLPKALSAGYILHSFRNCPLYLFAHFPHTCKCSEGGSLACPAPHGTRARDP